MCKKRISKINLLNTLFPVAPRIINVFPKYSLKTEK